MPHLDSARSTLPRWLRRRHVRDYLGISEEECSKLFRSGVLTPRYFGGGGRAYYERAALFAAEDSGKLFKPASSTP